MKGSAAAAVAGIALPGRVVVVGKGGPERAGRNVKGGGEVVREG